MKTRIRAILSIVVMILVMLFTSLPVNAKNTDKCRESGCYNDNTPNGTVFCDYHAAQYAKEKGYRTCAADKCWGYAVTNGKYCRSHTCKYAECTNKATDDEGYCSTHSHKNETSSKSYKKGTSYPSKEGKTNTGRNSRNSSRNNRTSKKKYDQYDVYDYKSAEEFADDKYEEFYDYEDGYEDEDEAYDAAEDYWKEHH